MDCRVNQQHLVIKSFYFFFLAGQACLKPFLPVYQRQLGLTTIHTGIITGVQPFIGMLVRPLIGAVADRHNRHAEMVSVAMVIVMALYFSAYFVPRIEPEGTSWLCAEDWEECTSLRVCRRLLSNSSCCQQLFPPVPDMPSSYNWDVELLVNITNSVTVNNATSSICCKSVSTDSHAILCSIFSKNGHYQVKNFTISDWSQESVKALQVQDINNGYNLQQTNTSVVNINRLKEQNRTTAYKNYLCFRDVLFENTTCFGCSLNVKDEHSSTAFSGTFWMLAVLIISGSAFAGAAMTQMDATTMQILGEKRGDYGKHRLWGSIGWGAFALIAGFGMDSTSDENQVTRTNYSFAFYGFLALSLVALGVTFKLPRSRRATATPHMLSHLGRLLLRPQVCTFLGVLIVMGMSFGIIQTFLFWFLKDLGGNQTLLGLTLTVTCLSEVPFLFMSGKLIEKIGHTGVLKITLVCYAFRLLFYSLLVNPWWVLPVELLHGVTYGAMWSTTASYASHLAPPGIEATIQGVVGAVHFGIGEGAGSLLGGVVYHKFGAVVLFRVQLFLCLGTCILYHISHWWVKHDVPGFAGGQVQAQILAEGDDLEELMEESEAVAMTTILAIKPPSSSASPDTGVSPDGTGSTHNLLTTVGPNTEFSPDEMGSTHDLLTTDDIGSTHNLLTTAGPDTEMNLDEMGSTQHLLTDTSPDNEVSPHEMGCTH